MTSTPKRPSDAEVVALLRREAEYLRAIRLATKPRTNDELSATADALEAASAEPFEAKVERAFSVITEWLGRRAKKVTARNEKAEVRALVVRMLRAAGGED